MATKKQFVASKKMQSTLEFNFKTTAVAVVPIFKSTVGDRDFKQLYIRP